MSGYVLYSALFLWLLFGVVAGALLNRACFLVRQRANLHTKGEVDHERRDI